MLSDFKGAPLSPKKPRGVKATSAEAEEITRAKKALLRRAKVSERTSARWLIDNDGPDPKYRGLTTSTGRIGHVTNIRADLLSRSYIGEAKNVKLPALLAKYWQLINQVSIDWMKDPVLIWHPSNADKYPVVGKPLPNIHMITAERHAELLRKEREYDERV